LALTAVLAAPFAADAAAPPDSLVKAGGTAIYYFANDGKRYVFPNEKTYKSWFVDFSGVVTVTDAELAAMPLGGNVTYRPGVRMVKIQTDPKVYAVARGGVLRWVQSEALAEDLYGQYWASAVDDVSDAFFVNYSIGAPVASPGDFSPLVEAEATDTIDADRGIAPSAAPRRADSEVANVVQAWRAFALADINRLRAENGGAPAATENALLDRIATIHSKDMALNIKALSHDGSLGETAHERIREGKVPDVMNHVFMYVPHPDNIVWSAENVGFTTRHGDQTVEESIAKIHGYFMDEPADQANHRTTMLGTMQAYSEVGIGPYVDADGTLWITEDYITKQ
jgi:uncharacterized protein YkwD